MKTNHYPKLWLDVIQEFDQLIGSSYEKVCQIKLEEEFDISNALMDEAPLSTLQEIIDSGKEIPVKIIGLKIRLAAKSNERSQVINKNHYSI